MSTGEPVNTTIYPTSTGNGCTITSTGMYINTGPTFTGAQTGTSTWFTQGAYASKDDLDALHDRLTEIENRLAIIRADEELMRKYPALKEAYDSYKLIEALVRDGKHGDTGKK